jgi:hypothetical protein
MCLFSPILRDLWLIYSYPKSDLFDTPLKNESMTKSMRIILVVLIILNMIVLLGQIWPEGAPPFAREVNILFLALSLLYFLSQIMGRKGGTT